MNLKLARILFCGLAMMLAVTAARAAPVKTIHLEAEEAQLTGNSVLKSRAGYSGTGYVGSFEPNGAKIIWTLPDVAAGIYTARLRYCAPSGDKGFDLVVNGAKFSGMLPASGNVFKTHGAGKVELQPGRNTVSIERGWGYYEIDSLDLVPVSATSALPKPSARPVDLQATAKTRALLAFLVKEYGDKTLSGQYDEADTEYIRSQTGRTPAILGGDLMDYSPSRIAHGSDPKGEVERLIRAAKAGQIVTLSWHWNAPGGLKDTPAHPWYKGFYTDATTFDVERALADPNSDDYQLLLRDIDAIAVQLQKFSDADVPVLWRPLHEAEGGWFWWGAKGPEPFKKLWRLMYDRLTKTHHLHNLIWVDCSGTKPDWYPGNQYVDVVGIDAYPSDVSDPLSGTWETLQGQHGGKKLVALTEFGGVPDVEKMRRFGVRWAYFVSWTGDLGPRKMPPDVLTRIYQSNVVGTARH